MARFKRIPQVQEGKIIYRDGIIDGIVLLAVKEIQHVKLDSKEHDSLTKNSAIDVRKEKEGVHIDITVKIHYLQNVSDMAFKIQESVRHNVEAMTEYRIASVNVHISGIYFEDELDEKQITIENKQENNI